LEKVCPTEVEKVCPTVWELEVPVVEPKAPVVVETVVPLEVNENSVAISETENKINQKCWFTKNQIASFI